MYTMLYRRCMCECVRAVFFLCCLKFHKSLNSLLGRSSNKENNHIDVYLYLYLYFCALLFDHQRNQNHNEKKLTVCQQVAAEETCVRVNFVSDKHRDRAATKEGKERDGSELAGKKMNRGQLRHICTEITIFMAWHGRVFQCVFTRCHSSESFHPHSISIKWNTYIVYCQSPKMANQLF